MVIENWPWPEPAGEPADDDWLFEPPREDEFGIRVPNKIIILGGEPDEVDDADRETNTGSGPGWL